MRNIILETERLLLRPLTTDDAQAVFEWAGDPIVARYMLYSKHKSIDETLQWLESLKNSPKDSFNWGFVRKSDGKLIGSGGVRYVDEEKAWMVGYNIRHDCWNMGYTTEAAKRFIKYAYEELDAHDFISDHAVDNPASGKVMEKCGLKFFRYGEYEKFDGSETFTAKYYKLHID